MNDKSKNNMQHEDTELARKLNQVSERTHMNPYFMDELEQKLKAAHKPQTVWRRRTTNSIMPSLAWAALVIAFGLFLSWSIRNLIPSVEPASNDIPTAQVFNDTPADTINPDAEPTHTPENGSYDWRGTKLYLTQPLPESPADTKVYLLNLNQPVTPDDALALAQRFGIQGEAQINSAGYSGYSVTDGKQKLQIQSNGYFTFYTDFNSFALGKIPQEQALSVIDNFLKKYGFDFEYRVESRLENASPLNEQLYYVAPLTSEGAEIRSDYLMPIRYQITIDGTGQNIIFSGFLLDYEVVGTFKLITAEEAFQSVLDDMPQFGLMESIRGKGGGGGGGTGFYKLNLKDVPMAFPTTLPEPNQAPTEYMVKENDTLSTIASRFGITVEELMNANNIAAPGLIIIDQKLIIPAAQPSSENPPIATIEKVELVYYLPNPLYGNTNPSPDTKYIQPAWRFYGHYSTGDEFEFLVQALKQEFLLPQLVPYTPPG